jgi:2-methylaconitate cis-trans-isomerase PrpF
MRGGARRAAFFHAYDLPNAPRVRDAMLLRAVGGRRSAVGGPDAGGGPVDGLGVGQDGVARVVVVSRSQRPGCDIDILCGTITAGASTIDWSGPCGPLAAAVGPLAVAERLFSWSEGPTRVRLQHLPDGARIDAFVPLSSGDVIEQGGFLEDGVPFASAEVRLEWIEPTEAPFPSGRTRDVLQLPGGVALDATLTSVGEPIAFVGADALGLSGREQSAEVDRNRRLLERMSRTGPPPTVRRAGGSSAAWCLTGRAACSPATCTSRTPAEPPRRHGAAPARSPSRG